MPSSNRDEEPREDGLLSLPGELERLLGEREPLRLLRPPPISLLLRPLKPPPLKPPPPAATETSPLLLLLLSARAASIEE